MTREKQDDIETRTKALFDDSVTDLDGRTRSRLTQARQRALAGAGRSRWVGSGFGFPVQAAAAAAAVAVVAAVLVMREPSETAPAIAGTAEFSDFDLLLEEDEFDLFEDLEFYAWLEEQLESDDAAVDGAG
jgi:hypothetical protein